MVVANEAGWLQGVDVVVKFLHAPGKGRAVAVVVPHAVQPDAVHAPIAREQFAELPFHKVEVGVIVGLAGMSLAVARPSRGIVGARPVDERIVEVEAQPLPVAFVGQFAHDVASEGRGRHAVCRLVGEPHREAVVVARGEAHVARPRLFEGCHPRPCVEAVGIERPGRLGIFGRVEARVAQVPFALSEEAVNAPMQEDAEAALGKLLPCFPVFGRRFVGIGRPQRRGMQQAASDERGHAGFQQSVHGSDSLIKGFLQR